MLDVDNKIWGLVLVMCFLSGLILILGFFLWFVKSKGIGVGNEDVNIDLLYMIFLKKFIIVWGFC